MIEVRALRVTLERFLDRLLAVSRTKLFAISSSRVSHPLVTVQLCCPASGGVNTTRNHYLFIIYYARRVACVDQ